MEFQACVEALWIHLQILLWNTSHLVKLVAPQSSEGLTVHWSQVHQKASRPNFFFHPIFLI